METNDAGKDENYPKRGLDCPLDRKQRHILRSLSPFHTKQDDSGSPELIEFSSKREIYVTLPKHIPKMFYRIRCAPVTPCDRYALVN